MNQVSSCRLPLAACRLPPRSLRIELITSGRTFSNGLFAFRRTSGRTLRTPYRASPARARAFCTAWDWVWRGRPAVHTHRKCAQRRQLGGAGLCRRCCGCKEAVPLPAVAPARQDAHAA
ncbi:hypothetical protein BX661DRAFT_17845 [Kickxella alabastrina]|uniref:uncharacterized protein n=1 Tax=Kickxella alabastrina TaxID=61397 RepID=UPI00221E9468|nr:uncharacterized protein BX661DRAFT_17845 [Kickxella alabastrina]KAI7827816.1 hypothetical protein BX661DRAFT_17845 [Kickxella alabastrina]